MNKQTNVDEKEREREREMIGCLMASIKSDLQPKQSDLCSGHLHTSYVQSHGLRFIL